MLQIDEAPKTLLRTFNFASRKTGTEWRGQ